MLFSLQLFVPSECLSDHLKLQLSIESTDCLKAQALLECLISNYVNWFHIKYSKHLIFTFPMKNHFVLILIMRAIITRSWFETSLDYTPRLLGPKLEEFTLLVHKLSVILTALQSKPQRKNEGVYVHLKTDKVDFKKKTPWFFFAYFFNPLIK